MSYQFAHDKAGHFVAVPTNPPQFGAVVPLTVSQFDHEIKQAANPVYSSSSGNGESMTLNITNSSLSTLASMEYLVFGWFVPGKQIKFTLTATGGYPSNPSASYRGSASARVGFYTALYTHEIPPGGWHHWGNWEEMAGNVITPFTGVNMVKCGSSSLTLTQPIPFWRYNMWVILYTESGQNHNTLDWVNASANLQIELI